MTTKHNKICQDCAKKAEYIFFAQPIHEFYCEEHSYVRFGIDESFRKLLDDKGILVKIK